MAHAVKDFVFIAKFLIRLNKRLLKTSKRRFSFKRKHRGSAQSYRSMRLRSIKILAGIKRLMPLANFTDVAILPTSCFDFNTVQSRILFSVR